MCEHRLLRHHVFFCKFTKSLFSFKIYKTMNHRQIEFDATGYCFQNKRVLWSSTGVPASYPSVMYVLTNINQAQKKWSILDAHKVACITEAESNQGPPSGATEYEQTRFAASTYFSSLLGGMSYTFYMELQEGAKDEKNNRDTLSRRLYRQLMLNPDIMHVLSILEVHILGSTVSFLEENKDYFPDYVSADTPITNHSQHQLGWLRSPMTTPRKLKFDCAIGRFVPNEQ